MSAIAERIARFAGEHPRAAAATAYGAVAIAAAAAAFFALFHQFATYDDEGALLVTLQAFIHGDVLYRDVISAYGPFYYEFFGGLFSLTGHAITTDASRSIVVVVWVLASLLFGLAAQRVTSSLMLGLAGMAAAFGALAALSGEPMHPHGLGVLLLAAFVLLAVSGPGRRVALLGGIGGALLAALLLTKINLGLFAVAAVALASVLTLEPLHRRRWVRWPVVAAYLAMPIAVMARDLGQAWVRDLIAVETLAAIAICIAASSLRPRGGEEAELWRWLRGAAVGLAIASLVLLGILLLTGPTPGDIYYGVVSEALEIRNILVLSPGLSPAVVVWGIAAVAGAYLSARLRGGRRDGVAIWPGLARALAGVTIWLSLARVAPFSFDAYRGGQNALPLVLAWIIAIPPGALDEPPYRRFLRVLLAALAAAETLQIYPVAGNQTGIAAAVFVPIGAFCLADGLFELRAWGAAGGRQTAERLTTVVAVAAIALAGTLAYGSILKPGASNAVYYRHGTELSLPGATLMRLTPTDAETYEGVVDLLHRYRCTSFVAYPSVNSLYLWSGIRPPPPGVPGTWVEALDRDQQQRVVEELRASPRPCVLKSNGRAESWLTGDPPPPGPLVSYVFEARPVATVGDFRFLLPRRPAGEAVRSVE